LKRAEELYVEEKDPQGALDELHSAIQNRRNRFNNQILERIMTFIIDVCKENLTVGYLKEDFSHFRNLCQHSNMNLLEHIVTYLRTETEKLITALEEKKGVEKIKEILARNVENVVDESPEDLLILANCEFDTMKEREEVFPKVTFLIEVYKIILDSLRQNSKLIDFYNDTAKRGFEFCRKYACKQEFRYLSETLHSHFNQIIDVAKNREKALKIPFPVRLEEDETLKKVFFIRTEQLRMALHMGEWSDAYRTCENIYKLINKQKSQAIRMKSYL